MYMLYLYVYLSLPIVHALVPRYATNIDPKRHRFQNFSQIIFR